MIKSIKPIIALTGLLVAAGSLSGCLESPDIVSFEPGVYQGASDPLTASIDSAALQERFSNQMDR